VDVRPHPRYRELLYRLRSIARKAPPANGVAFRSVEFEYARAADILSGEGSFRAGGRWNAPGSFPVIYSSTRPGAAVEEAFQLASEFDLAEADLRPRVICGVRWELSAVLDLTAIQLPGWINLENWMKEDYRAINDRGIESLCQAFGRALRNLGVTAILCPSARVENAVNLVVFRDRLRRKDMIRLISEDDVKKYFA